MKVAQRRIVGLGELVDSLFTSLPFLSLLNFFSVMALLYQNTKEYILNILPWFNFIYFLALLGLITIITMVLIYKFVIPSLWSFRETQMFKQESDVVKRLERIEKLLEK